MNDLCLLQIPVSTISYRLSKYWVLLAKTMYVRWILTMIWVNTNYLESNRSLSNKYLYIYLALSWIWPSLYRSNWKDREILTLEKIDRCISLSSPVFWWFKKWKDLSLNTSLSRFVVVFRFREIDFATAIAGQIGTQMVESR